jgi:hypothetical protein
MIPNLTSHDGDIFNLLDVSDKPILVLKTIDLAWEHLGSVNLCANVNETASGCSKGQI